MTLFLILVGLAAPAALAAICNIVGIALALAGLLIVIAMLPAIIGMAPVLAPLLVPLGMLALIFGPLWGVSPLASWLLRRGASERVRELLQFGLAYAWIGILVSLGAYAQHLYPTHH